MKKKDLELPQEVAAIRAEISRFFSTTVEDGHRLGSYYGAYVFFDYDEEPIYVGQSSESLGGRVGRHLTNQRTDAVAMSVLDPFEVAFIEVYPLCHKDDPNPLPRKVLARRLDELEFTVFQKVLRESKLGAVLNEKDLIQTDEIALPRSYKERIVPSPIFETRQHADVRIARRASTIARLAQVISERSVSAGLRRTLLVQARRLEMLADSRFATFANEVEVADSGEETGETVSE